MSRLRCESVPWLRRTSTDAHRRQDHERNLRWDDSRLAHPRCDPWNPPAPREAPCRLQGGKDQERGRHLVRMDARVERQLEVDRGGTETWLVQDVVCLSVCYQYPHPAGSYPARADGTKATSRSREGRFVACLSRPPRPRLASYGFSSAATAVQEERRSAPPPAGSSRARQRRVQRLPGSSSWSVLPLSCPPSRADLAALLPQRMTCSPGTLRYAGRVGTLRVGVATHRGSGVGMLTQDVSTGGVYHGKMVVSICGIRGAAWATC